MTDTQPNESVSDSEDSGATPGLVQPQDQGAAQQATGVSTVITPPITADPCVEQKKRTSVRKDKGHLHAVRHGALARYPLEALRHLGEDVKALRRLERRFRAELKPRRLIADLVFDRFWSSYLRCLLAARAEASAFLPPDHDASKGAHAPELIQADLPTLMVDDEQEAKVLRQALEPDVLRQLLLVQRYDRHFSREMYQALGLLLVLRANGEPGLEQCITRMIGAGKENSL